MNYQFKELKQEDLADINFLFQDLYEIAGPILFDIAIIGEQDNDRSKRVIFKNEWLIVLYELSYDEKFEKCLWKKHIITLENDQVNYFENANFAYTYKANSVAINDKEHNIMEYLEVRTKDNLGYICHYIEDLNTDKKYTVAYEQNFPYEDTKLVPYALQKPLVIENYKGKKKTRALMCSKDFNNKVFLYHMLKKYGLRLVWETMVVEGEEFPDEFYVIEGQSLSKTYTLEEIEQKMVIPSLSKEIIAMYNKEGFEEENLVNETIADIKNYVSKNGVKTKVYIRE